MLQIRLFCHASRHIEHSCVALCCNVLQCVATCCSVLQRVAEGCRCCRVLQSVAECCRLLQSVLQVLRHVAECCRVLHSVAACCSVFRVSRAESGLALRVFSCVFYPEVRMKKRVSLSLSLRPVIFLSLSLFICTSARH